MSMKVRDVEELLRRHGFERGTRKVLMLLAENLIAQQEALQEAGKTLDMAMQVIATMGNVNEAIANSQRMVQRKLGIDIDDGDIPEPVQDIGKRDN